MKYLISIILLSITQSICAKQGWSQRSILAYTVPSSIQNDSKEKLRNLALDINDKSPTGVFIVEPEPKEQLQKAVSELEAVCGAPSEEFRKTMVGDWKLLCTINTPKYTTSLAEKSPFKIPDIFTSNPIQEKIRESVEVTQRIRCIEDDNYIDRVDNVIEFTPFSLEDLVSSLSINLNPLEVSKSKVTLAHKAEVQSIKPVLRTKISLQSVILTVAGTSQNLDPKGADVLGFNVPLGDFLNAGSFDTTYVDEDIRVSRGTVGLIDQLRVFVRKDNGELLDTVEEVIDLKEDESNDIIIDEVVDDNIIDEVVDDIVEEVSDVDEDVLTEETTEESNVIQSSEEAPKADKVVDIKDESEENSNEGLEDTDSVESDKKQ